jgi:hypothetical protein
VKPALILVGADKGGVGKTTVSRILLDYFADRGMPARAFDTEAPRGTLARFYPDITEIVSMAQTSGQMQIIDTLEEDADRITLVDVRAGELRAILEALQEFGFLDAAGEGEFTFMLFHILGSSIASLSEIAETSPFAANAHYYLVKNHVGDGTYFEWDPTTYRNYFNRVKSATEITISKLDDLAYEQVDLAGVPFSQFIEDRANSFVLRGYVRSWLHQNWVALDEAGVAGELSAKAKRPRRAAR